MDKLGSSFTSSTVVGAEEKASKDRLLEQGKYTDSVDDDEEDLELNEISTQSSSSIISRKRGRLRCASQKEWADSLSPSNPLFLVIIPLFVIAVFGWMGLFICLDGGCSRSGALRKDFPGWNVVPDCRQTNSRLPSRSLEMAK